MSKHSKTKTAPVKRKQVKWKSKGTKNRHALLELVASADDIIWIKNNIKMRKCNRYMPFEENMDICQCGYEKDKHQRSALSHSKQGANRPASSLKWECSKHTDRLETNAFGKIKFHPGGNTEAKFVRVDTETDMSTMLEMLKRWQMEKPNMIISVTGGTRGFNLKPELENVFKKGLMKAAYKIGAWIITGGTYAGVMKYVGKAIQENDSKNEKPIVTIGIAPWGVIKNRTELEKINNQEKIKTSIPVEYHVKKNNENDQNEKESYLDPNHSHFILVDDGTQHQFKTEISFRARLEQEISKMPRYGKTDVQPVPIVMLVLQGGESTLETVENALMKNIPAVILKNSGGVADILAYAFEKANTVEVDAKEEGRDIKRAEKHVNPRLEDDIEEKMKSIGAKKDIKNNIELIKKILTKSDLIHIFESDTGDQHIDAIMVKALLMAYKNHAMDQIAGTGKMTNSLDDMMFYAIQFDSVNFVELLLDYGIQLEKVLTIKRLLDLYNNVSSKDSLKKAWLKIIEEVSSKSKSKDSKRKKDEKKIKLNDVGSLIQNLLGDNYLPHYVKDQDQKKDNGGDFNNPYLDLFIWSVLNNHQEMAKLFWRHGKDKMAAALIAYALFSAMSHRIEDRELRAEIEKNGSEFMTLAIKVANKCYETDPKKTQHLVILELQQWGNTTCIEIAVNAHDKRFISQHVCLDLLDEIWMEGLKQDYSIKKLLFCMAFPPLIPCLGRLKEKDYDQSYLSNDAKSSCGQEAICCFSSKQRRVAIDPTNEGDGKKDQNNVKLNKTETGNIDQASDKSNKITDNSGQAPVKSGQTTTADIDKAKNKQTKEEHGNGDQAKDLSAWKKFKTFYKAPIIIFMHNVISFIAFLSLYSYVLISKLQPEMSVEEYVLIVWVGSFLSGEIVQVLRRPASCIWKKFKLYIRDGWNVLDMLTIVLFSIGMVVLRITSQPLVIEIARVILGVDLVLFFLRLLHIFHAHRQIGPKLVMIMSMVWDVAYLGAIIGVIILAFAVASYAILYPNTELTIDTVIDILKRPYWNIYGELYLAQIEGDEDCSDNKALYENGILPRCPTKSGQYVVPVMMGVYVLTTNILLISLLIATFSYSIENIQQHTDLHCTLHRYNLICEYYTKPFLAHPLALLIYLTEIPSLICGNDSGKNAFKQTFTEKDIDELRKFEEFIADKVFKKIEEKHPESMNTIAKRLEKVESKLNELQLAVTSKQHKSLTTQKIPTVAESTLPNLETREKTIEQQLQDISTWMQSIDKKISVKETIPGETVKEEGIRVSRQPAGT